jgi:predicted nuclease of predicted toxin-antitoxin system
VNEIKLYFDEDAMHSRLVTALRSRGVTVLTVMDAGLTEKSDEEQLPFATERECVLYTFNVSDFFRLHSQWISEGRKHAGIILAPQQRFSVGEQLRRILRIRASKTLSGMWNQIEFLSNWD